MHVDSAAACDLSEPSLASRGVNDGVIPDFCSLSACSHWNVSTFTLPVSAKVELPSRRSKPENPSSARRCDGGLLQGASRPPPHCLFHSHQSTDSFHLLPVIPATFADVETQVIGARTALLSPLLLPFVRQIPLKSTVRRERQLWQGVLERSVL